MSTSPQFEPANLLEIALKNAAEDPAAGPIFYRELMESKVLIIPAGEKPRIIDGAVPADSRISIANVMFDGMPHVPFFSSEKRVPLGSEYLLLDAKALFEITRGAHLVLNPGLPYGKQFLPDEAARLLDGTIFEPRERFVAQKEIQVLIGQPKDYPSELVAALCRLYADLPAVKRAWLGFYHNPERDKESALLIAIDADVSAMERISGESGVVIERVPKKQKFVDLIRFDGAGLSGYFAKQKPFYERNKIGSLLGRLFRRN
jgi:hypothetical protein